MQEEPKKQWTLQDFLDAMPDGCDVAVVSWPGDENRAWYIPRQVHKDSISWLRVTNGVPEMFSGIRSLEFVGIGYGSPFKVSFPINMRLNVGLVIKED